MSISNKILSKLSIKILVVTLVCISIFSCIIIGAAALLSSDKQSIDQDKLVKFSAIQQSSANVNESLINFRNRQSSILSARTQNIVQTHSNQDEITLEYQSALNELSALTIEDQNLVELIASLNTHFSAFQKTDQSIYNTTLKLLSSKEAAINLAIEIDTLLNEIDSLIGAITGKLRFSEKRKSRKIKRQVKKFDLTADYYEHDKVTQLIKNISNVVLNKKSNHLETIVNIKSDLLRLSANTKQLLISSNIDTVLSLRKNKIDQNINSINDLLQKLSVAFPDNDEINMLVIKLTQSMNQFIKSAILDQSSIYNLQLLIIASNVQQLKVINQSSKLSVDLDKTINSILDTIISSRKVVTEQSIINTKTNRNLIIIISIVVVIFLSMLGIFIVIGTNRPLCKVSAAFHEIAQGDGDLTQRLNTNVIKEVSVIAVEFNQFIEKIAHAIKKVDEASSNLFNSSLTLQQVSEQTQNNINNQQIETTQASGAMIEMTKAAQSIAENAENARESSQNVLDESENSNELINGVVLTIKNLAQEIKNTSDSVNQLDQFSVSIGTVLDVIRGISEQTNLLALNAAIEAARAGEQGRGFAVVADEVRSLASRTQESTIEIEDMIKQLQKGAQNAVIAIEAGTTVANNAVDKASIAANSLNAISEGIVKIASMNTAIASAAEEQSAVSQEINSNVNEIQSLGFKTVKGTEDTKLSGEKLAQLSSELQNLMAQFKI